MNESLELGSIPFYWRAKRSVSQPPIDIPTTLPFAFTFDPTVQLVVQRREKSVLDCLKRVYREDANVGYLQESHALAQSYGGEFLDFFRRSCDTLTRRPRRVADIGCGGVYILLKLREQGFAVTGIDPSPVTAAAGARVGIEIVRDFYPSAGFREQFDILTHYDVLEHVEDPVAFLNAHRNNMPDDGAIIFAVPDCTHHIAVGDLSMILHEHLNYFDADSLARTVRAAGFEPAAIERSRHGGVLFCCAKPSSRAVAAGGVGADWTKFSRFRERSGRAVRAFSDAVQGPTDGQLGLYVPLRAFPYLGNVPEGVRLRFFDDDPGLHGRYYDGFDVPVENSEDLKRTPPSLLLICSFAFGTRIAERLRGEGLGRTRMVLWADLFAQSS